jgi:hypothetical protein
MHNTLRFALACAFLAGLGSVRGMAQTVIIDFDDSPGSAGPFSEGTPVLDQYLIDDEYAALGVRFDSGGGGLSLSAPSNPVSAPNTVGATQPGPALSYTMPVEATFELLGGAAIVDSVSLTLTNSSASSSLEAYDLNGLLLGGDVGAASAVLTVDFPGLIHRVVLRQGPMAFDDFSFTNLTTAAPSFCAGTGCACGNDDASSGCTNSTGLGSRLSYAGGSLSVAADDLTLRASDLPGGQSGVLFASRNTTQVVFGDGLRCVGSPAVRYPVQMADAAGHLEQGLIASLGSFAAGETGYFQVWYRDPVGPCLGGFNLSSGLAITLMP